MFNLALLTSASIRTITRQTCRAVILRLLAIRATGIVTWLAITLCCFETRFAAFADIGISETVDAVVIFTAVNLDYCQHEND